jgi:hypothetical protein
VICRAPLFRSGNIAFISKMPVDVKCAASFQRETKDEKISRSSGRKIYMRLNCDAGEMKEHKFAFYWMMYIHLFRRSGKA